LGKTTLVQQLLGDRAGIVTFDPVADVENPRAEPELFLKSHRTALVPDEVL
jgi:hypothetical protein